MIRPAHRSLWSPRRRPVVLGCLIAAVMLGGCTDPTAPVRDPCDQGLFFVDQETSLPTGESISMLVWRGAKGIDFMGGGMVCGRTTVAASWTSSNTAVASVQPATREWASEHEVEIRGLAPGRAEISARAGGETATMIIVVFDH